MRWSAQRLAPCNKSSAWPSAKSLLASMRQIWLTRPEHCRANAVQLPTNPPPPMMETFTESPHKRYFPMPRNPAPVGLQPDDFHQPVHFARSISLKLHMPLI